MGIGDQVSMRTEMPNGPVVGKVKLCVVGGGILLDTV